ncbi:MAG TPA: extracellular solute-binding protein [Anaerolineales bacterium]|nr:extracellular solute-binding protein [Anaerolineales bacterium]
MMPSILRLVVSLGCIFTAGCASLEPILASLTPAPVPTRTAQATSTSPPQPTGTAPITPETSSLRVWLPAQFSPVAENSAAEMLAERLREFESQHADLQIEVRSKSAEAQGDILNALSVTSAAAPGALPDLVLLSRSDLEMAALLGLLHPIDGLSTSLDDPNWYGYAQQLAHIQNTGYGLPVLGDTLVLIYYPELGQLVSWEDVLATDGDLVFPAGNVQALVGLSLYASAGGEVLDPQGLPMLDEEVLARVLTLVEEGVSRETFPPSVANITNDAQALQIYRTGNANKAIVSYLNYRPSEDGTAIPLPGLEEMSFSYATGWVWALAGASPENQQLAVELAEFLIDEDFLSEWTQATGYLPTRPSIVQDGDRTMNAILESAQPVPSNDVLEVLGPLMQEALTRVLSGEQPEDVAGSVVEKLR